MSSFTSRDCGKVERAFTRLEVKAYKDDARIIEGWATTPTPDRVGDIVEPMGAQIGKGVKLLWQHNHNEPVGSVTFGKPTNKGIPFKATFMRPKDDYPQTLKDRLEEAWVSVRDGLVEFVSIGFRTIAYEIMETGLRFTEWEMMELSLVTIPANSEATITSIKSIDRKLRAASGTLHTDDGRKAARVGAPPKERTAKGVTPMSTISEKISALEADEANIVKQLNKFDVENMDEADEERFDDLEAELDDIRKKLKRLTRLESINAEKDAKPVNAKGAKEASKSRGEYQRNTVKGPNSNIPKGIPFARSVMCLAAAGGNSFLAAQVAEKQYEDDKRIANFLRAKAAVPGAYTSDSGGWAEDIAEAQTIGSEFIDFLRPMTIVDRMQGFRRVPFNVKVPRLTTGQQGYWVGEAKPAPLTSGVFDTVTLGKTKVASISVLTKEQIKFSNIAAESTIRDDLAGGVIATLDSTFIGTGAASAGVSPAGLLNGVSAQSSAGDTADDVRTDLANLYKLFSAANIRLGSIGFVTTERLQKAISLMRSSLGIAEFPGADTTLDGQPFLGSNHVGGGDFIAISAPDILLADDGEVSIEMSDQASLEMLDGSLEQDLTSGTGSPTAGMVSMFQTGAVAIKVSRYINWQKARAAAVQYVGDATYLGVATA